MIIENIYVSVYYHLWYVLFLLFIKFKWTGIDTVSLVTWSRSIIKHVTEVSTTLEMDDRISNIDTYLPCTHISTHHFNSWHHIWLISNLFHFALCCNIIKRWPTCIHKIYIQILNNCVKGVSYYSITCLNQSQIWCHFCLTHKM